MRECFKNKQANRTNKHIESNFEICNVHLSNKSEEGVISSSDRTF